MLMVTGAGVRINFRWDTSGQMDVDTYIALNRCAGVVGFAHGFDGAFPNKSTGFIQRAPVQ